MTKPRARKPYWVYDRLHGQNYYLCPGFSQEDVAFAVRKNHGIDWSPKNLMASASCFEVLSQDGILGIWIWIKEFDKKSPSSLNRLVHECVHAAMFSLSLRGYSIDPTGDHEILAYKTAFIFEEFWRQLK